MFAPLKSQASQVNSRIARDYSRDFKRNRLNRKYAKSIVMMGATGAVGDEAVKQLLSTPGIEQLTLLGRRKLEGEEFTRIDKDAVLQFETSCKKVGLKPFFGKTLTS